ncbi:hypothetical protein BS47DRAFT_1340149 [Hydnum rufescens UP504]|uniref:Uncharacterized protein n=1 Tax=Hydnum rufescens UP504 TaxID=1448309 RepID=A0A9P6B3Q9_9AGAM|nr:hypothetical protein BS47DRAFT_1340149 [Hydnum rufescens UP504]
MSSLYAPTPQSPYETIPVRSAGIVPTPDSNNDFEKGGTLLAAMDIQRLPPYLVLSNILGFRERFSLLFFIVFGGALVGFVLGTCAMRASKYSD